MARREPNRLESSKKQLHICFFLVYENLPAPTPVIDKTQVALGRRVDFPTKLIAGIGQQLAGMLVTGRIKQKRLNGRMLYGFGKEYLSTIPYTQ